MDNNDMQAIWDAIAAPVDPDKIKQKPTFYTDKATGKKVEGAKISYIDKTTVEERLNSVVPGDWHFQVTPIVTPLNGSDGQWVVKGTLTICGVTREDFGVNEQEDRFDPPKAAVSDALKRCAALFGLGRELVPGHGAKRGKPTNVTPKHSPATPPTVAPEATHGNQGASAQGEAQNGAQRPYSPSQLRDWFELISKTLPNASREVGSVKDAAGLHKLFSKTGLDNDAAYAFAFAMFGVDGFGNLSEAQERIMALWLKDIKSARQEAQDCIKLAAMSAPNQE